MKAVKVAVVVNCNQLCTLIKNKLITYFSLALKAILDVVRSKPLFKYWWFFLMLFCFNFNVRVCLVNYP